MLAELGTITHPGATRRIMMEALRGGLGADMTASFIRARTLHAGDAAVELVFRITSKAVAFDIAEVWVRDGSAVSATAVIAAPRDFTLGDGIELAKLAAGRIESAEPPMDRELIRDCVHCGFCLPSCPSYVVFNDEMDSPRGRIYLMQAALDGTVQLNRTVAEHFDRCLGCMACLTSCPSGVKYDKLIELAREQVEEEVSRPLSQRLMRRFVFTVFPHPKRLRTALRFSSLPAPGPLKPLRDLKPTWSEAVSPPVETPARGEKLARVGLLTGCVQSVLFGEVNRASARVLSAYGYEVTAPYGECCGALALHAASARKVSSARGASRRR